MKEHPIIFSGPMVRAILEDRKTQTRRVIKPQPKYSFPKVQEVWNCPYGKPGDLIWVRETWATIWTEYEPDENQTIWDVPHRIEYKADTDAKYPGGWPSDSGDDPDCPKWHPSIHMPRCASRITLEITDVRVERVQEISPEDCEAEGITGKTLASPMRGQPYEEYENEDGIIYTTPILAFAALWDSINLKRGYGWDKNPWVWVIAFKRIKP